MKIIKVSPITGKIHEMDMAVTQAEWDAYQNGSQLIQDAFPNLTPDEREFLMTGITPEEWDQYMRDEDETFTRPLED